MRIKQQSGYVLINRPYSETSWITEVFSRGYGRLSLMSKGARRAKSKLKGILQPFQPLLLSWSGKGEVPTLTGAEIDGQINQLDNDAQICAFYCNEIIVKALHKHDPHPKLFDLYEETLSRFSVSVNSLDSRDSLREFNNSLLRQFERGLLAEIGFGLDFGIEARSKEAVQENGRYLYQAGLGFVKASDNSLNSISGKSLLYLNSDSMMSSEFVDRHSQLEARRLMRELLKPIVGTRGLRSRDLFFPLQSANRN